MRPTGARFIPTSARSKQSIWTVSVVKTLPLRTFATNSRRTERSVWCLDHVRDQIEDLDLPRQ